MSPANLKLGEVATFLSGFAFKSEKFNSEGRGLPIIRIRDVVRGQSHTFYDDDFDPRYLVEDGDYLIGMDGEFNLARWCGGQALLNQRVCKLDKLRNDVDRAYVARFLPLALKKIEDATPFVTVKHLGVKDLNGIVLPLPSLDEQRRIAAILDQAEELRAKRRAAIALLDQLPQAIFLDLFGDPATNPKEWSVQRVGSVADVQGGLQVTRARRNLPIEVPYLRVANVYRGHLNLSEIKTIRATDGEIARTRLLKDDFLIVEGHGNPEEIGRGALWDGSIHDCIHQNHIIRARFSPDIIVPLYACHYLNSPGGRRHLLRAGKTTSGLNTISVSEVRGTPVAIPPIELQREFARRVAAVDKLMAVHRASLIELDALFASLQHRAFAGELFADAQEATAPS